MQATSLAGHSVLIVEDEPLIAHDIGAAFLQAGAIVVSARSLPDAVRLVENDRLSAAVLDFGLGDRYADGLCERLKQRDIPFILHSGYPHVTDACHDGIVISKPASPQVLVDTLVKILRQRGSVGDHV